MFILEPWANEYPMAPGERFVVEGNGPEGGTFSIESTEDGENVVVWAWDGSDARVLREDGTVVADWTELRVPNFQELDRQRDGSNQ
ncbi:MAG: hypothetical protein JWO05_3148 [Gemmatimonadetes bacterium]|nr:hypothetical protein [Gemmatimonadota bacterium]